jgi:hypothetical protein
MSDFDELVREAELAPIEGWDFSWLDGISTDLARQTSRSTVALLTSASALDRHFCHAGQARSAVRSGTR